MRLAIFGSTGGTGLELTRQALGHGHHVRVLVRNPNRMPLAHPNMRVVLGDLMNPVLAQESVTKTVLGCDAVLSCLGQGKNMLRNTQVVSAGTRQIMAVMRQHGLRRLVVESAFGACESYALAGLGTRLMIATLLRVYFQDKDIMEPEVKASGLDWTILRPTILTRGPLTNRYTVDSARPAVSRVSRADVAAAMLRAIEEQRWIGQSPTVTGPCDSKAGSRPGPRLESRFGSQTGTPPSSQPGTRLG